MPSRNCNATTLLRTLQAADFAGIRTFAVHARDDEAKSFYELFNFVPSPSDPDHLFRLLKDRQALLPARQSRLDVAMRRNAKPPQPAPPAVYNGSRGHLR